MSVDRLREAAKVLRDNATAAAHGAPGPWRTWITSDRKWTIVDSNSHGSLAPARCVDDDVAHYIATMHPGVGLALADWLDAEAKREAYSLSEFGHRIVSNGAHDIADLILDGAS